MNYGWGAWMVEWAWIRKHLFGLIWMEIIKCVNDYCRLSVGSGFWYTHRHKCYSSRELNVPIKLNLKE